MTCRDSRPGANFYRYLTDARGSSRLNSHWRRLAFLPALLLAACGDAPRDPVAMLVAPEAKAALEVGATLPTVPELVQRVSGSDTLPSDLAHAATLWEEAST